MRGRPCRVWDSPGVLNRRSPRVLVSGLLLALAVVSLSACRTSPSVAAYVGGATVTTAELSEAVDARRQDPLIAAYADSDEAAYTRQVLGLLVEEEVYAAAAQRYDVAVSDSEVRERIEVLLDGDAPGDVYDQLAGQGISRADVAENVRQRLLRQQIAVAEGVATEPTQAQLQARYAEVAQDRAQLRFGYVTVPDQPTADAVLAQLRAAPDSYPAIAQTYAGQYTLPQLEVRPGEQLPGALAGQLAALEPGTGFTVVVGQVTGVVVGFLDDIVYPDFDDVRPQLDQEVADAASQAGAALVAEVRSDLEITVNPRFGQLGDDGALVPVGSRVVDLLEDRVG